MVYKRTPPTALPPHGTFSNKRVLTTAEARFYRMLLAAFPDSLVLPKIHLLEFIKSHNPRDNGRITGKHVDFLLANEHGNPHCAIELDDPSHNRPETAPHDLVKDFYVNASGTPLLRVKTGQMDSLKTADLHEMVANAKADRNMPYPITPREEETPSPKINQAQPPSPDFQQPPRTEFDLQMEARRKTLLEQDHLKKRKKDKALAIAILAGLLLAAVLWLILR